MKIRSLLAVLMAAVMCAACAGPAWAAKSAKAKAPTMADSVNTLNWTLYDAMADTKNLFYSPYSIESALALADAGAQGETKAQMEKVMGITDFDAFLKDYKAYISKEQSETAKLTTANGIWINTMRLGKDEIKASYLKNVKENMGAEARAEAFDGKTADEISRWVKDATDGFIGDYKPIVSSDTVVDLINAIYFYGEWSRPFSKNDTYKEDFTSVDGTKSSVDMMHLREGAMRYYSNGKFRGLELPYKDGTIAMDLVLPAGDSALDVAKQWSQVSAAERSAFLDALGKAEPDLLSELALPKFSFDNTINSLPGILQRAGMVDAFEGGKANFESMARGVYITDIQHRAKIEVDEKGSKAAAVTEIVMEKAMLMPADSIRFRCDRPFLYFIRDTENGMILFTGIVNRL